MNIYRTIIAVLIAIGVATAPIGSAAAHAMGKSAMHDCHGKKPPSDHSCCDKMSSAPDVCGFKCCKLMGTIVSVPPIVAPGLFVPDTVEAAKPPDRLPRPPPPPPRS